MGAKTKIRLTRPDGTTLDATPEQADKLRLLGYKDQTPEGREAENVATGQEAFYTSGDQQVSTAIEGIGRGASLGLTDYALDDPETAKRAHYNPGLAMATEALGAIGPLLIPGAGEAVLAKEAGAAARIAARTPSALLSRGSGALAEGIGLESRAARTIVKGTLEGAGFGGTASADHAYLSGDPVTSEAVLHGMGWGALFGGGLSAIGVTAEKGGEAARTAIAAREAAEQAASVRGATATAGGQAFDIVRSEVSSLSKVLREANATADAAMSGSAKRIMQLGQEAGIPAKELGIGVQALKKAEKAFDQAVEFGNMARIQKAQEAYEATMGAITKRLGIAAPETGAAALTELRTLRTVQRELEKFPRSFTEFASMSEQRAERLFATMGEAKKLSKFPELAQSVNDAASQMSEALGIRGDGIAGLRATWRAAKEAHKAEGRAAVEATKTGVVGNIAATAGAAMVGKAVKTSTRSVGAGFAAYGVAKTAIKQLFSAGNKLMAIRNGVLGRLEQAAAAYAPSGGKALQKAGPRLEPLAVKLDGTPDTSTTNRQDLAAARVREVMQAAPGIKDTLFRAVEPLAVTQPELGPGLHKAAVGAFAALKAMMPADPGVVSGLKSIWKPSPLQAAVVGKQYEVFLDPPGVAERMILTNNFDPIQTRALREIAPAVFNHLRVAMLQKITMPGFLDKTTYRDQIGLGSMLDIPIHSSMRPAYIAAAQQIFLDRNQPLATPAVPGAENGGGRPASDNQLATQSQRIEAR